MAPPKENLPVPDVACEAAKWFVELQGSGPSREQHRGFAEWLCRSPAHIEEFLRLTVLAGALGRVPDLENADVGELLRDLRDETSRQIIPILSTASPAALDSEAAPNWTLQQRQEQWKEGREGEQEYEELAWMPGQARHRNHVRPGAALAIALTLLTVAGLWLYAARRDYLGSERYATGLSEELSLTLADGSQVELNARSQLGATVNTRVRELWLKDGEALFRVAKDHVHPFRVDTPQATIEAKGTQFNVERIGDATVVSLLEGHVLVSPRNWTPVMLSPGEQITIANDDLMPPKPRMVNMKAVIAWTEHRLVFDDTPLSNVIVEFNRYSAEPFVIKDPSLRGLRITASFDTASGRSFAQALAAAGTLRVTRQGSGAYLIERQ